VVSGAFATVSLGGFISNGGHGALSAKYGLGADQVYEIDLVTPMGEIITANECQNRDYFWAMRGGGGSTYGVALAYTIKAYPAVSSVSYRTDVSGWNELMVWYRNWPKLAMVGGSGYFNGYPMRGNGRVRVNFKVPNMTEAELEAIVEPIMAQIGREGSSRSGGKRSGKDPDNDEEIRRKNTYFRAEGVSIARQRGVFAEHDKHESPFHKYEEVAEETHPLNKRATFPGMGTNKIIASWLWSEKDLQHPNLEQALRGAFDEPTQMLNDATMGVGTHKPPYIRGGGNAVNPAFRTAVMRPASELQWGGTDPALLARKKNDSLNFVKSYMSIAPEGGTYANEVCRSRYNA
jgi:hypothetical protein